MQSRGPTAQRGLQFSQTTVPELLEALANARARLAELQMLGESERAPLRKEVLDLQTDLRAELRRREI